MENYFPSRLTLVYIQKRCRELYIIRYFQNFEFLENFWSIFLDDSFVGLFLERIFWEDFLGRNSLFTLLKSAKLFESERDWCFCQDFVSMEKEERRRRRKISILRSASASILHLKRIEKELKLNMKLNMKSIMKLNKNWR